MKSNKPKEKHASQYLKNTESKNIHMLMEAFKTRYDYFRETKNHRNVPI